MNAELREWYKAHHICAMCGREPVYQHYVNCIYCRMKQRDRNKIEYGKHKDDEEYKDERRAFRKQLYEKRKQEGLCPKCGREITNKNYIYCEYCRANDRNRKKEKRLESGSMPQEIRTSGIYCYNCLKPLEKQDVKNGIRVCKECREKNAKALEIARASRNPENDYFRKLNTEHFEIMKQGRRTE